MEKKISPKKLRKKGCEEIRQREKQEVLEITNRKSSKYLLALSRKIVFGLGTP
jgi:hypothetical protein